MCEVGDVETYNHEKHLMAMTLKMWSACMCITRTSMLVELGKRSSLE